MTSLHYYILCIIHGLIYKITQNGPWGSNCNLEVLGNEHASVSGMPAHLGVSLSSSTLERHLLQPHQGIFLLYDFLSSI